MNHRRSRRRRRQQAGWGRLALAAGVVTVVAGCVESGSFLPAAPTVPAPRLPMNDAYVGSVHSGRAGALAPRFVWEGSTASAKGQVRYELQYSRDAGFAAEATTTVETLETWHQVEGALEVSQVAPVGARYYWRVRACLRESCSEYTRTWWVNLGRVIKDYNGDGYSDVAVGAPGNDGATLNGGRVFVYYGGPGQGLDGTPDVLLGSFDVQGEEYPLGYAVTYAGDVNGDGFGDLLVGNDGSETPPIRGAAYVWLGGSPFDTRLDLALEASELNDLFGWRVRALGDLNADGYSDFAVVASLRGKRQAYVFLGNGGVRFSRVLAGVLVWDGSFVDMGGIGDINGDGYADIALGRGSNDDFTMPGTGLALLYFGGSELNLSRPPDLTVLGAYDADFFGATVGGADLTCDGFSELVVANVRTDDFGLAEAGRVDVFVGAASFDTKADVSLVGQTIKDAFGSALAAGGDFNGDGCGDLAIGAPLAFESGARTGRAFVYRGGESLDASPEAVLRLAEDANSAFREVRNLGDINGDGYDDLGAANSGMAPSGAVDVYLGGPGATFEPTIDTRLRGAAANDYFGAQLAVAGPLIEGEARSRSARRGRAVASRGTEPRRSASGRSIMKKEGRRGPR